MHPFNRYSLIVFYILFSIACSGQGSLESIRMNEPICIMRIDKPMMVEISKIEPSETGINVTVNEIIIINKNRFVHRFGMDSLQLFLIQNAPVEKGDLLIVKSQNEIVFPLSEELKVQGTNRKLPQENKEVLLLLNAYLRMDEIFSIYHLKGKITEIMGRVNIP